MIELLRETLGKFKSRLARSSMFSVVQTIVVMICFFLVYRFLVASIGIERVGVWSLLMAIASLARLGDVSGGGALGRFVAISLKNEDPLEVRSLVHTVILSSIGINLVLGAGILLVSPIMLPSFIKPVYLAEANTLLPYVVAAMIVGGPATSMASGLDGAMRADQRSIIVSVAAIAFLGLSFWLVPTWGVTGFGLAQILQQVVISLLGWLVLRRNIQQLGWFPWKWDNKMFFKTVGYSVKLSSISVVNVMFDPLVKFAFNSLGGPALVGYYELISRFVQQIRSIAVAAVTPLIPVFASLGMSDQESLERLLLKSTRASAWYALFMSVACLTGAPLLSIFMLNHINNEMLLIGVGLSVGWSLNLMSLGFYFAGQGRGVLRWNFLNHLIIAAFVVLSVVLMNGPLATKAMSSGPNAVVMAIAIGMSIGGLASLLGNAIEMKMLKVVRKQSTLLLILSFVIISISFTATEVYRFLAD